MKSQNNAFYLILISLILGISLGWVLFGGNANPTSGTAEHQHDIGEDPSVWTCSMHPQIRKDGPGQCPICGMDLIPVEASGEDSALSLSEIKLSQAAMKLADIETVAVGKSIPIKEINFPGKVKADERRIAQLSARFGGRIEKLFINFTGQRVRKNQKLLSIYSPDLITAQKELFEAAKYKEDRPSFYRAARNKLKLWDLSDRQIDEIEAVQQPKISFDVLAPISGTVTMRHVAQGDYVQEGTSLLEVTNLERVWVLFDTYESDLPWVKIGDRIDFTIKSRPSETFRSTVTFIDPVVDPEARVAYVRTELDNGSNILKPEMFANGILKTRLPRIEEAITVPKSAILWTGKRAIVYVKAPNKTGVFEHREISLGEDAGSYFVVTSGLQEGEEVAVNGVFKVDAAAQLQSKQSMMTPAGGKSSLGGHAGMDMGGENPPPKIEPSDEDTINHSEPMMDSSMLDPEFSQQLLSVIDGYLDLKNYLVAGDQKAAANAASSTAAALAQVEMSRLKSAGHHQIWMQSADSMQGAVEAIQSSADIQAQRLSFRTLSDGLIAVVQDLQLDLGDRRLFVDYCPMAIGSDGAYWLSEIESIENPYYGDAMLACGEIRETL